MQKVEVVIRPDALQGVSEALRKAKISRIQANDVTTFDTGRAPAGRYRGVVYEAGRERVKIELVLPDHEVQLAIEAIRRGIDPVLDRDAELWVVDVRDVVPLGAAQWERPPASIR